MTVFDLQQRILQRVGEDLAAAAINQYYTAGEALAGLNMAQRIFVLITLCLEKTGTITLAANQPFYHMLSTFSDWLVPLRIRSASGKVWPARFSDFGALDSKWTASPSTADPIKYAMHGFDLMGIYRPPANTPTLTVTYARCPVTLVTTADVPEIPEEYHPALIDGAIVIMRTQEGAQEFEKVLPLWQRFMTEANRLAEYVRSRDQEQGYDTMPLELQRYDTSHLPPGSQAAQ